MDTDAPETEADGAAPDSTAGDDSASPPADRSAPADDRDRESDTEGGGALATVAPPVPSIDDPFDELPRGSAVGSYVILTRLASGTVGTSYAAFDPELDRKIALKLVNVNDASAAAAATRRDMLVAAANSAAAVEHPGVVRVYDVGVVGTAVYVAMEFVDGIDVRQWIEARDDPFPWPEVLRVFTEAGRGLAAAHAMGCTHGDFTPSRVLLDKQGRARVFDFGMGLSSRDPTAPALTLDALRDALPVDMRTDEDSMLELPRATERGGTPGYMAPEVHAGLQPDAKADQFAFCAALYEALYGEPPFSGQSPSMIAVEIMSHRVRPAPEASDVPPWLRAVLLRGLSPRRRDRYASMETLLRELEHDPKGRRRRWLGGGVGLALVLGTGAAVAYLLEHEAGRCDADEALLEGAWDEQTRAALEDAFVASGRPYAAESWDGVQASLDEWSAQWLEYRTLACQLMRADDDAALLEQRNACLDGVLAPVRTFAAVYQRPRPDMIEAAPRVVAGLWRPEDCRESDMLEYAATSTRGVHSGDTNRAWLELLAHADEASRAQALEAEQSLRGSDARGTRVRAQLLAGIAAARGHAPDAQLLLHEAAGLAAAARLRIPMIEAWIALGRTGELGQRSLWLDYAETAMEGLDLRDLRAELFVARGDLAQDNDSDHDALSAYHRALALLKAAHARAATLRSDVLLRLARLAIAREEWNSAEQYLGQVVAERSTLFGAEHPELLPALEALARVQRSTARPEAAARTLDRAMEIVSAMPGNDATAASLHIALGDVERDRGQPQPATHQYELAVKLLEHHDHPQALATALVKLGTAHLDSRAPGLAAPALQRAKRLAERLAWSQADRAPVWERLGLALSPTDPAEARNLLEQALAAFERAGNKPAATRVSQALTTLPPRPSTPD